jgi:hypothetical protein
MRPPRQIYDQADILNEAEVTLHEPDRPSWQCPTCAQPWPCGRLRVHLMATLTQQEIGLHMGGYVRDAERELAGTVAPMAVHYRLFAWIRDGVDRPPPPVRRPPGGPF